VSAGNRNELWARTLLDELARAGLREVVVCPGSRSTPLVLAAAAHPALRTLVQLDERSGGFLALGVGKATGRPAAVITTSGTAVANLLPAVVEASQAEVPLLLLTADRPPHLRGADANQAIDQERIFGRYSRAFHELSPERISGATLRYLRSTAARAFAEAAGDPAGPVHLNLPFAKPLEPVAVAGDLPPELEVDEPLAAEGRPSNAPFTRVYPRRAAPSDEALETLAGHLARARRPLIVAGPNPRPFELGPLVGRAAAAWRAPLLADPLSGGRSDAPRGTAVAGYDLFLRSPRARRALRPDLILRVGQSPTSAALLGFLEEAADVRQVVVDGGARWKDHLAVASEFVPADAATTLRALLSRSPVRGEGTPAPVTDPGWSARWRTADRAARGVLDGLDGGAFFEGLVLAEAFVATPSDALLFVSSSMPVRDLDAFGLPRSGGPLVLGNRGASGIDGIVSTAIGTGIGSGRPVVAVLGDLALLHDANGLLAIREAGVPVVFVVVNNDGGGIFHLLPVREYEPAFTRFFATPHGREPERVAALHDLPFLRIEARAATAEAAPPLAALRGALREALAADASLLVEVRTDREENRIRRGEVVAAVQEAVEAALAGVDGEG